MTIIMIEATAEELSANRTIMNNLNDALNNFTDRICGINNINYEQAFAKAMAENEEQEE